MKILIWILCIFGFTFVNILIQNAIGFGLGPVLLMPLIFFVARALCDKWDEAHGKGKKIEGLEGADPKDLWTCAKCGTANLRKVKTCQKCGVTQKWSDSHQKANQPAAPAQPQYPAGEAGETTVLSAGDTTVLSASEAGQTTVLNESGHLKLYVTSLEMEVILRKSNSLAGTDVNADLKLGQLPNAQYLSRKHASLTYSGGTWYLRDEGSSNGTYLNQYPLEANMYYPLSVGDVISFAGREHATVVEFA